jgi:hypothetical protein
MALVGLVGLAMPALAAPGSKTRSLLTSDDAPAGYRVRSQALGGAAPVLAGAPALDVSKFAFTAPGRGAQRTQTMERGFRFTPSGGSGGRQVTVGVSGRTTASGQAPTAAGRAAAATTASTGMAPASYDFDLAVAWKGVALTGEVSRLDSGGAGQREGVGVGLSYGKSGWRTGVRATAERGSTLIPQAEGRRTERLAIEATSAIAVGPALSLGGSVRYQPAPLRPTPLDPNREDRAVFLGGRVAF